MGSEHKFAAGVGEINENVNVRNRFLMNYMAEAALADSEKAGFSLEKVFETGESWVLSKIRLEFMGAVPYGPPLSVYTWHKGGLECYGFRDYQILCAGVPVINATSVWVYTSIIKRKAIRAPEVPDEIFGTEKRDATGYDIHSWKPVTDFTPDFTGHITVRPSDYDPLKHVNNAVYIDYIETLWALFDTERRRRFRAINLQYIREIKPGVNSVAGHLHKENEDTFLFSLCNNGTVHAGGRIELSPENGPE